VSEAATALGCIGLLFRAALAERLSNPRLAAGDPALAEVAALLLGKAEWVPSETIAAGQMLEDCSGRDGLAALVAAVRALLPSALVLQKQPPPRLADVVGACVGALDPDELERLVGTGRNLGVVRYAARDQGGMT
jgi:hypothetical protein